MTWLLLSVALAMDPMLVDAAGEVSTSYASCQEASKGPASGAVPVCEAALESVKRLTALLAEHPEWPESATMPSKVSVYEAILDRAVAHLRRQEAASAIVARSAPITNEGSGVVTRIEITREQIKILERIYFETGSAEVDPMWRPLLGEVAAAILDNPDAIGKIEVAGHTDYLGDADENMKLSLARAQAVVDLLVKAGVSPLDLEAKGYGETMPIATNYTPQGRERNRRVEFHIVDAAPLFPEAPPLTGE